LAILAQCDLLPDQKIVVDGIEFTMADYVAQVQYDVPRNVRREYSWTLIGLTTYLDTDTQWVASDGQTWNIARLLEYELEQDRDSSSCGGTHRMIGMAMALRHHVTQQRAVEGPWLRTQERIQQSIRDAREYQNTDGSFSSRYFTRGGTSFDVGASLGSTGHVLEFLTLSLSDEQLREPWVKRSVVYLCDLLEKTKEVPLECGALYHAVHGLVLYRQRMFGPRDSWGQGTEKVAHSQHRQSLPERPE
jgi:hypothetical protein